ncbi:MAG: substrate-binding domain-containing protein, partial [Verrucomicrobia bacterium]|nr:substrate-binding domain-containing protein [Verrucomicrobiota bacterium]
DLMALGAVEAIAAAGKRDRIVVVGFDATADARTAVREGKMAASVAQHPEEMGRLAVERAVDLLQGKPLPAEIPTRVELITRENL